MSQEDGPERSERIELRARPEEREVWEHYAKLEGLSLSAWLRKCARGSFVQCACVRVEQELQKGNRMRAKFDALRAILGILEPFGPAEQGAIKEAVEAISLERFDALGHQVNPRAVCPSCRCFTNDLDGEHPCPNPTCPSHGERGP